MEQQSQSPTGPGGRRLHIAHRRSPSELTPLMMEQLALQAQIDRLQQQQQMYNNMGGMGLMAPGVSPVQFNPSPVQQSPQNFQFPQQSPQGAAPPGAPTQPSSHRRNQSAMPGIGQGGGPPPAPSSGASNFGDFSMNAPAGGNAPRPPRRGSEQGAQGHGRRHSLTLPNAIRAAGLRREQQGQPPGQPGQQGQGSQGSPSGGADGSPTGNAATPSTNSDTPSTTAATSEAGSTTSASTAATTQSTQGPTLGPPRAMRGHGRSQSLAVGMSGRSPVSGRIGSFQFPPPMATNDAGANLGQQQSQQGGQSVERRASNPNFQPGHGRTGSRNYEGNWRNQNQNAPQDIQNQGQQGQQQQQFNNAGFQPGHRVRASMGASIGSFQFPPQPNLMIPGAGGQGIFINPATGQPQLMTPQLLQQQQQFSQMQQLQQAALNAQLGGMGQGPNQGMSNQQQQQQRKTLFTPYLPQANLPALLANGQLVSGILRVNKKNRSDAYVSTQDGLLDADIFICGSKDRNRALEGDLVAIELLDVDEVWGQKREKEEKKKRKDIGDSNRGSVSNAPPGDSNKGDGQEGGGIRRRGSLRQRPTQKKNDDVEVEGQSLLLVEEDEINDEQKPLYAGHVVAVVERVAGQMFSGTLGLLRPSSQATKEKQEAERAAREGHAPRPSVSERPQDKPKIVWFKPTDKRVPLIAIPTEQAPRDFVENHQSYANRIFVACIKRWPITSLHPFGTLVEQLGEMGDMKVETDALLRDNNFGPDDFSDPVLRNVGFDNWTVESESEEFLAARKDFREEQTFSMTVKGENEINNAFHVKKLDDGKWEIGVHVSDIVHFVKANSLVDREAKKRGTAVELLDRYVPMLPQKLSEDLVSLKSGQDRLAFSVVFTVDGTTGVIEGEPFVGKSIVRNDNVYKFAELDPIFSGETEGLSEDVKSAISALGIVTKKFRAQRYNNDLPEIPPMRLLYGMDDENIPVEENVFESLLTYEIAEELLIKTESIVAEKLAEKLPEKAFLRRLNPPNQRRLDMFGERMNRLGQDLDITSSAALISGLLKREDPTIRKGLETLLVKATQRGKYFVSGRLPVDMRSHYVYNLPVYTHFTKPIRRYADVVVQRQLEAALSDGAIEFTEDSENLVKTAEQCNVKKDSAKNAQEQSIHIALCRTVDKRRQDNGGELICEAIVINVYESAFDVLIPEYGFEKRVHCDQLPLKKAEFSKTDRLLELFWEKGVQSNQYVPEDERPKGNAAIRAANEAAAAQKAKQEQEREEQQRKNMDISSLSINDVDALFDDDEEEATEPVTESTQDDGLSAPQQSGRPTQSMPGSPKTSSQTPHRTRSDPKLSVSAKEGKNAELSLKEKYSSMFTLRQDAGENIQEVRELTRVPVFLKTELSKSPPCLTIRSLNPYAL